MQRVLWLTDLHLNFAPPDAITRLQDEIRSHAPDVVLVGGDTGEADSFAGFLTSLVEPLAVSTWFVLGNHDYYGSPIQCVRDTAWQLSRQSPHLGWLPDSGVVQMTEDAVLIGHGGWADGRSGDFFNSDVLLNDYVRIPDLYAVAAPAIREFRTMPHHGFRFPAELFRELNRLGDEAARYLQARLPEAAERGRSIWVLMHVPPFREACWHQNQISDDNWAPHFVCQAAGEVLAEFMRQHPEHTMTVLCGHTHSPGRAQILPNLLAVTGGAEYTCPGVQQLLTVA